METGDTIRELFDPTFEAVGDSDLSYAQKRELLYNLYCFAVAVDPEYAAHPCNTLFEYGCCFLIEPERHPDYSEQKHEFSHTTASADVLPSGGRWYKRRGEYFIKYDYGSPLFERLVIAQVIPPQDRTPIAQLSLYAAVYCVCKLVESLRPLWFTYYFYLDATNEPIEEAYDEKLFELLHEKSVYAAAMEVKGSMLVGDEAELSGAKKLLDWYAPFIEYRRAHIVDVWQNHMQRGDVGFVCEYSSAMLDYYPENATFMNWNAAARTERVIATHDIAELKTLVRDLREYAQAIDSPSVKKYLKLAELMLKNVNNG